MCRFRPALAIASLLLVAVQHSQLRGDAGLLTPKPGRGSSLTTDGLPYASTKFAELMAKTLAPAGASNVRNASFLFQQCFGGAMLYDLKLTLKDSIAWAGGSAASWYQIATAQMSPKEFADRKRLDKTFKPKIPEAVLVSPQPLGFWTAPLAEELNAPGNTVIDAIEAAVVRDPIGPFGLALENGQSVSSGEPFALNDIGAKSHHAVLFGGRPDATRHANSIDLIRQTLITAWGDPKTNKDVTITILFGKGGRKFGDIVAREATPFQLEKAMKDLTLGTDAQFVFYGGDHGNTTDVGRRPNEPKKVPKKLAPAAVDATAFDLEPGDFEAFQDDPFNVPTLYVDYVGVNLPDVNEVLLNGHSLGFLEPALSSAAFAIPEQYLLPTNEWRIVNGQTQELTILSSFFDGGSIDQYPARIPEPATVLSAVAALCMLRHATRRRSQRRR